MSKTNSFVDARRPSCGPARRSRLVARPGDTAMSLRGCSRFLAILARLFALAGLGVMATAITLGQRNPPKPAHRSPRSDRLFWISGRIIGDDVNSRFFDAESGLTVP